MEPIKVGRRDAGGAIEGPEQGYHQNWYAVALSEEVRPGQVIGKELLDGRVIVYRGEDGRPRVQSAYCPHLGADLAVGTVIGDEIRCAFHHWSYGSDGRCTRIPVGQRIPERARLLSLPTAERWGLIWAFNGEQPLFDVPGFRSFGPSALVWRTIEHETLYPVAPWVLVTNSHDLQHLRAVHGLKLPRGGVDNMALRKYCIEHDVVFETPDGITFEQELRVTGTNTVSFTRKGALGCSLSMWTGTRLPNGQTKGYMISAAQKPEVDSAEGRQSALQTIVMTEAFTLHLIREDEPVMRTIRFREGVLLPEDRELSLFLRYVRSFPRANPLADYM